MLDLVLARRRGLPILLSVVYIEVARRGGIPLAGVGLPGHFVVGHFDTDPPLLLDPFAGGRPIDGDLAPGLARRWRAHEIAMRMLNNLVAAYDRRGDLSCACARPACGSCSQPNGRCATRCRPNSGRWKHDSTDDVRAPTTLAGAARASARTRTP
jgi:hypothetical protein